MKEKKNNERIKMLLCFIYAAARAGMAGNTSIVSYP